MSDITPKPYPLKKLYNPLSRDFTVTYDIHETGEPVAFTIHAEEIESFEEPVALHIAGHLAYELAQQIRGRGTFEDAKARALEMIYAPIRELEGQL